MNIVALLAWTGIQIFIFTMSIWFIVYGIRIWNHKKSIALFIFIFALAGIFNVIESFWASGLL